MIQAQFGLPDIAMRTLELYTTATLDATLAPTAAPPEPGAAMERARRHRGACLPRGRLREPQLRPVLSCRHPRGRARRDANRQPSGPARPQRAASKRCARSPGCSPGRRPDCSCRPGSAPAKRCAQPSTGGSRLRPRDVQEWPFFRSTVDLIEMVLAKTDERIAAEYDRQLVPPELKPLGADLRGRLDETIAVVLEVTGRRSCSRTTACCGGRSTCATPTSIRSTSCRSNCYGACGGTATRPAADVDRIHDHRQRDRRRHAEYGLRLPGLAISRIRAHRQPAPPSLTPLLPTPRRHAPQSLDVGGLDRIEELRPARRPREQHRSDTT